MALLIAFGVEMDINTVTTLRELRIEVIKAFWIDAAKAFREDEIGIRRSIVADFLNRFPEALVHLGKDVAYVCYLLE